MTSGSTARHHAGSQRLALAGRPRRMPSEARRATTEDRFQLIYALQEYRNAGLILCDLDILGEAHARMARIRAAVFCNESSPACFA
jgi:hypothetical protein